MGKQKAPSATGRGRLAEEMVAMRVADLGWRILGRNVRTAAGELDLVAREGDVLVVVEVKARCGRTCGSGLEAIDRRKERRLRAATALWLAERGMPASPVRFDAVLVELSRLGAPLSLTHLRDVIGDGH